MGCKGSKVSKKPKAKSAPKRKTDSKKGADKWVASPFD